MAARKPLILLNGKIQELPATDTLVTGTNLDTIYALGSVSGSVSIDVSLGSVFTATLTGTTTLTFTGQPSSGFDKAFVLQFANDQTINLPSNTKYAEATPPDVTSASYQIICSIDSAGQLTVYGILNDIIDTP